MVYKKHCCYGLCNNDSRYPNRPGMEDVFFINFPKPKTQLAKCERWIRNCGRPKDQFNVSRISKDTFICSKHFVGGYGPTDGHPDPIPATACDEQIKKFSRPPRKAPSQRDITHPAPSSKRKRMDTDTDDVVVAEALVRLSSLGHIHETGHSSHQEPSTRISVDTQTDPVRIEPIDCGAAAKHNAGTQTIYTNYELRSRIENIILKNDATAVPVAVDTPLLNLKSLKDDDNKMKFFTGLTFLQFIALFKFLGPSTSRLTYWNRSSKPANIKPTEELLITLTRLRRGYCFKTMTYFFNLSETALRCIFSTWLQLLYCHFSSLRYKMFPERSALKKFMPKSFRGFKNIRCSIDCTEIFVQMPRNLSRQGNLFSNYKHHHTFKCLIAVAPNGTAVFVSQLYEGAMSDRQIFEKCGILDHLNPGDLVLVDRGFTVEDLLMSRQVHMNIPPFLKGRDRLTPQEELLTRKIAKARIHVERFNERLKKFRLISGIMPLNMTPLASQAVFVASCLVNFQDQLAV